MSWVTEVVERARALLFRDSEERALSEELRFHVEMETEKNVREGLERREARRRALVKLGGVERTKEAVRDARGTRALEDLASDFRHAVRRMRRSPGLTAAIVLTFALGIGASTTMFGVLDRLLLQPPEHVRAPDRVKRLLNERYMEWMGEPYLSESSSMVALDAMESVPAFEAVAAWSPRPMVIGEGRAAREARGELVSHDYFELLGVRPALGRFFVAADDRRGAEGVVVLGHGFWQRRYGGAPDVIGETVDFGHGPYTVVGVAPPGFAGVEMVPVDLWLPLRSAGPAFYQDPRWFTAPGWTWLRLVARLAPGAGVEGAEAAATTVFRRTHPEEDPDAEVVVAPLIAARGPLAPAEAAITTWLFGVTVLVLLIVSANIANMLLARGVRRRRETGIRLALGGARGRLIREAVVEALLMSGLGAAAALGLAGLADGAVRAALIPDAPGAGTNGRVALFAALAALLAAGMAGLLPAIQSSRADVLDTLKGGRTASPRVSTTRRALAVVQTALSVLLLVGAGLFLRSLQQVARIDLGIATEDALLVQPLFEENATEAERRTFLLRATERIRHHPAVAHASPLAGSIPFVKSQSGGLYLPGRDSVPTPPGGGPYLAAVHPDYFPALDLRVVRGRGLRADDREGTEPVILVNRTLARWLWPDGPALGQCLQIISDESPCRTVVGVVEDAHRHQLVEEAAAQIYLPFDQNPFAAAPEAVVVRGHGGAAGLRRAVRDEVLAGPVRFAGVRALDEILAPQTRPWRVGALLFTGFGVLALLVAAIGVYAVLAFAVAQRQRELGIRAALGARRPQLARIVFGHSLRLVTAGLAIGLGVALLAGRRIEPLLQDVSSHDPWVLGAVTLLLVAVGILAAAAPARRATTVEPREALTAE